MDPCQGEARWLSMKIKFANKVYAGKKDEGWRGFRDFQTRFWKKKFIREKILN